MKPRHDQLGLSAARDEPDLDSVVVSEDEQERHGAARHVRHLTVEGGVVDVRRLKPGPGHLTFWVLARLVKSLDLVNESWKIFQ